ncbi:hypothetical protein RCCS2_12384 [Roseobacter sp. CCS2]|nr:hypothetical protein RCCS2_12384 [Roseobacter sp. CCS2]
MHVLFLIAAVVLIPISIAPMRAVWVWINILVLTSGYCWLTLLLVPAPDQEFAWAIAVLYVAGLNFLILISFAIRIWACRFTREAW